MILKIDSTWDRSDSEARENSMRYHVLYTRIIKQWELLKEIKKQLPDKCSTAFIPCCELWWRGQEETVIKPMFSGYIFLETDTPEKVHDTLKEMPKLTVLLSLVGNSAFSNF